MGVIANKGCYNEIVIEADAWVAKLPSVVEAVQFPIHASEEVKAMARRVHRAFVTAFSEEAGHTPLLSYDVSQLDAPFALAPVSED